MAVIELEAKKRDGIKKSAAKNYRREGFIPSIIYGQEENKNILINKNVFQKAAQTLTKSTIIKLKLDDKDYEVLIKDYQKDYIKNEFIHLDFYELKAGKVVHFSIPITIVGNAIGVREGGILERLLTEVDVECLPKDIVHHFEVNIDKLNVNDSLHVSDIDIDEDKFKILSSPEDVIVHISGKKEEEEEEVAEALEGEEAAAATEEGAEAPETSEQEEAKEE